MFSSTRDIDEDDSLAAPISPIATKDRPNMKVAWRGRKAAANASHLPMLNKRNLFSLSWNTESNLSDFQAQFDYKFDHSLELRWAYFDALANSFFSGRWFSEAAVCRAHALAIIGKELVARDLINIDWSLFDFINDEITSEEYVYETCDNSQRQAGFTVEDFMTEIEKTLQMLTLSERYEAIGPLCRLAIPIYESLSDYKSLSKLYSELQQSCNRAEELRVSGKRHLGSYFRVTFYGVSHFRNEHKSEWVYCEPRLTSLAEACDRITKSLREALGHDNIEILSPNFDERSLKPTSAYVLITYVEPCLAVKIGGLKRKLPVNCINIETPKYGVLRDPISGDEYWLAESMGNSSSYYFHTNVKTFVYVERVEDSLAKHNMPEQARQAVKRTVLTVEKYFPSTKRRQRVVGRTEFVQTPLEVACECLYLKAAQIRQIIDAAEIPRMTCDGVADAFSSKKLDVKRLQLLLQGAVSPMVNAGVLSYAETFTAPDQQARYGLSEISNLVAAFKVLIETLHHALIVNEAAIGSKRSEYQSMLRKSFNEMLEKLWAFFGGELFQLTQKSNALDSSSVVSSELDKSFFQQHKFASPRKKPNERGDAFSCQKSADCLLRFNANRQKPNNLKLYE